MTKKEALQIAREVKAGCTEFNNVHDEMGYDLYEFEVDGLKLNVFAYIRKGKDEEYGNKSYVIYTGVEYDGGDNIYTDYETTPMTLMALSSKLYELANYYKSEEAIKELKKMMQ